MRWVVQLSTGTDTASCRGTKTLIYKNLVVQKTVGLAMQGLRVCLRKRFGFALYDSKRPKGRSLSWASFVLGQVLLSALSSVSRCG